jgi:HK97 family phage portal protein
MGRRLRHNIHTRELSAADFAAPSIQNTSFYQSGNTSGTDFFNLPSASPSGHVVNDITAMRVSAVYSCVEKIAVISSLPKHIYEQTSSGQQRIDHDYWALLNTEPSAAWTAASFWEREITSMLLRGDGLAEIIRPNQYSSKVSGIKPLLRESVFISMSGDRLAYKITGLDGKTYTRDQDDVLHFPGFGFNGFHGMSVIQHAAKNGIGIALAADTYSAEFFANGQRPDYLLTTDGTLSADQRKATKESLEDQHRGVGNRFKPLVLQGGLKMQPLSMTAEDSQLLETRKFQVVDVCMAFGVPPQLIGAQDSTAGWAGSNLEQLNLGFAKYTLRGHIARIVQEINRKLFKNTKYFIEFNLDAFLEGDSAAQAAYFSKAVGGPGSQGWMKVNEVRKLKNLPADDSNEGKYDSVILSGSKPLTTGQPNDTTTA